MGAVIRIKRFSKEFSRFFVYFVGFNALVFLVALTIRSPVFIKFKGAKGLDYVTQALGLSVLQTNNYTILRYKAFPYRTSIDVDLKMNKNTLVSWMQKNGMEFHDINVRLAVWSLDDQKFYVTNGFFHTSKEDCKNTKQLRVIFDSDTNHCYYRERR